ncbi:hypothetical protein [Methanobacterium spitsbergense]|nr:hypothetical protein [Methanobacterium spitsbergense]
MKYNQLVGVVFLILAGYMVVNSLMDKANQEKLNASTKHLIHH